MYPEVCHVCIVCRIILYRVVPYLTLPCLILSYLSGVFGESFWDVSAYVGDYPSRGCAAADPSKGYKWVNRDCALELPFLCMVGGRVWVRLRVR